MAKNKTLIDRIEELERFLEELEDTISKLLAERYNLQFSARVRLAKTWSDDPGQYPADPANTLPILFVDGDVDQATPGEKTITYTPHSADTRNATTISGDHVARDLAVIVLEQNGKFWIWA